MLLEGTVVADADSVYPDGAVVVSGSTIEAVGSRDRIVDRYPSHERQRYDVISPGLVAGHVHSVQSIGRGIADDVALLDWLDDHVLPMEAAMSADDMTVAARLGYLELIESGVTTCIDHLSVHHADRAFEAAAELGIRGVLGKALMDTGEPAELTESTADALADSRRLIERFHGTRGDRLRYAVTPRSAMTCTEACLRGARTLADAYEDVRIHSHAGETREENAAIRRERGAGNVDWYHDVGLTGSDVVLAHCVWTDDSERELLAETGTHVVYCPSANMKLASGVAPIVDYLNRGVSIAIGSDGPPCNNTLDPFTELRQACVLQKVDRLDPAALTAPKVFELATIGGARAAGFDRVGALREGWSADLIGLRTDVARATPVHDVHAHLVYSAHGDDVAFSMVDGTVLMEEGRVTVADAGTIRRNATAAAESII